MAEYIDKSKTYDYATLYDWLISSVGPEPPVWTDAHIDELMNDFLIFPNDTPTADVAEVRHGRWHDVYMSSASSFVGTCSICGVSNDIPPVSLAKYCPNCGAKMDGGQGE